MAAVVMAALAGCGDGAASPHVTKAAAHPDTASITSSPPVAPAAPFGQPQSYRDGISITVSDVHRFTPSPGVLKQWGIRPGHVPARFMLVLTNGSQKPWTPGTSGVSVRVGKEDAAAQLLCDPKAGVDCKHGLKLGPMAPGTSRTAVVGFAGPADALSRVVVSILPDNDHIAARWAGSVTG